MLYGDVSIFMRHGFAKELLMLLSSKSVTQIVTLLPLGVLGFFYLSYRISLKVYKRGLETCDWCAETVWVFTLVLLVSCGLYTLNFDDTDTKMEATISGDVLTLKVVGIEGEFTFMEK